MRISVITRVRGAVGSLLAVLLFALPAALQAQAPTITYSGGQRNFTLNQAVTTVTPTTTNAPSGPFMKGEVVNLVNPRIQNGALAPTQVTTVPQPTFVEGTTSGTNIRVTSNAGGSYEVDVFGGFPRTFNNSLVTRPSMSLSYGPLGGVIYVDPGTDRIVHFGGNANNLVIGGNPTTPTSGNNNGSSTPSDYALFDDPIAVAPVPNQLMKLYVTDQNNDKLRILDVNSQTTSDVTITGVTLSHPRGLVQANATTWYLSDDHRLIRLVFSAFNQAAATVVAGSGNAGDTDGQPNASELNTPWHLSMTFDGKVMIADRMNHKVKMYDPVTSNLITVAGTGAAGDVLSAAGTAQLDQPTHAFFTNNIGSGGYQLVVADYGNNKVKTLYATPAFTISPSLSQGLNFNPFTGAITGTPTLEQSLRTHTITLTTTSGVATATLPIRVVAPVPANLGYGASNFIYTVGTAITPLRAGNTGGIISNYTVYPALPRGLALNATTGAITGTPLEGSPQTDYEITGTNTGGATSVTLTIYVQGPPYNMGYTRPSAVLIQNEPAYLLPLPASFPAPTGFALNSQSPALPAGLSLNTVTGEITGTPTTATQPTTILVNVTNAFGTATGSVQLEVKARPTISYTPPSGPLLVGQTITPLTASLGGGSIQAGTGGWTNSGVPKGGSIAFLHLGGLNYLKFAPQGNFFRLTGGSNLGITLAGGAPTYVVQDNQGFIYNISNTTNRITKVPDGNTSAIIRQWGNRDGVAGNQDGSAFTARFNNMGQPAVDAVGSKLIIPDRGSRTIRLLNALTNQVSTIAGSGSAGTANGIGSAASFTDPVAVTIGADDNAYVLDNQGGTWKIRKVDMHTYEVSDWYTLSIVPTPYIVTDKSGDIYVGQAGAQNKVLWRINRQGIALPTTPTYTGGGGTDPNNINSEFGPMSVSPANGEVVIGSGNGANDFFYTPGESLTITPSLFTGLSFDPLNGTISGTPTGAGLTVANNTQTYTIRATNRAGVYTTQLTLTIVRPPAGLSYSYDPWNIAFGMTTPVHTRNDALINTEGMPRETYSVSPALPSGLTLNPANGRITGQATGLSAMTTYRVTAANAYGSTFKDIQIRVADVPRPAYQTPQVYVVNQAITPLTPTNTGAPVLQNAEVRLSAVIASSTGSIRSIKFNGSKTALYALVDSSGETIIRKYSPTGVYLGSADCPSTDVNSNLSSYAAPGGSRAIAVVGDDIYVGGTGNEPHLLYVNGQTLAPGVPVSNFTLLNYMYQENISDMQISNGKLFISANSMGISEYDIIGGANLVPATRYPNFSFTDWNTGITTIINNYITDYLDASGSASNISGLQSFIFTSNGSLLFYDRFSASSGFKQLTYNSTTAQWEETAIVPQSNIQGLWLNNVSGMAEMPDGTIAFGSTGVLGFVDFTTLTGGYLAGQESSPGSGSYVQGTQDGQIPSPNPSNTPEPSLTDPSSLMVGSDGELLFSDGGLVRKYVDRSAYKSTPRLPAGLVLDVQTGVISGTPTVVTPPTDYRISAYNDIGSRSTVLRMEIGKPLDFSYQHPSNPGLQNQPYPWTGGIVTTPQFNAVPVNNAVTWDITDPNAQFFNFTTLVPSGVQFSVNPALPVGMSLNTATGQISGTPTVSRAIQTYTVNAVNIFGTTTANLRFAVSGPSSLSYTNNNSITFVEGTARTVNAILGGSINSPTYTVSSGSLPTGLTVNSAGALVYDGLGAAASATTVTITAQDASSNTASNTVSITILPPGTAPSNLAYPNSQLVTGSAITPITPTVTTGSSQPITYSISPGLPAGLSFNTSTGVISGTPAGVTTLITYTVRATTIYGTSAPATFTLQVFNPPTNLSLGSSVFAFWQNEPITVINPTVNQGSGVVTFSATGLPAGLTIDPASGTIYGIPTTAQAATAATITATTAYGSVSVSPTFEIVAPPAISYTGNISTTVSTALSQAFAATISGGYNNTITISPAGFTAATGLTFSTANGNVTGTASATPSGPTTYTVTVQSATVDDSTKSATASFTVTVASLPSGLSYTSPGPLPVFQSIANVTPSVTLGSGQNLFSATGLPAGLSISPTTGIIYGTPQQTQATTPATVSLTNGFGSPVTAQVNFQIGAPPRNLSYPQGAYSFATTASSQTITPTLGSGTATSWSISPALPSGFSFSTSTGVITGMNSSVASGVYTVTASNSFGSASTFIQIATGVAPAFSYTSPAAYLAGNTITPVNPTVTAGTGGAAYTISPALPSGLVLDPVTGEISGTPTIGSSSAQTTYTVTATNAFGSSTATIQLSVQGPATISYASSYVFSTGTAITAVNPTVSANPAITGYSISPSLNTNTGLTFNTTTGQISGTPTIQGGAVSYTVSATNGVLPAPSATFTVAVGVPPSVSYSGTHNYVTGTAITTIVPTRAGSGVITYSISPALPAGLSFNTANAEITGTPTAVSAATPYTVTATSSYGTGTGTITIATGEAPAGLTYTVINTNLPTGTAMTALNPTLVTAGSGAATWSISPALPAGLTLSTTTGVISGNPSAVSASTTFTVVVQNAFGQTTGTLAFATGNAPAGLTYTVSNANLPTGAAITALNPALATAGTGVATWSIAPALPAGLAFDLTTGIVSGTPTAVSTSTTYTIVVQNAFGQTTGTLAFATGIAPAGLSYTVSNANLPTGAAVTALNPALATAGTGAATWSISPALPGGLSLSTTTGVISGTPTAVVANTTYTVTVQNAFGQTTGTLAFATGDAPVGMQYNSPNTFTAGTAITALTPQFSQQPTPNATYSISPALPTGLVLSTSTGAISGTPQSGLSVANATYTVTVQNAFGQTTANLDIEVQGPPTGLTYGGNLSFAVNSSVPNTAVPTVVATPAVSSYTISPTTLPQGVSFNTTTGAFSGVPTGAASVGTYTVTASNGILPTTTVTFTLTITAQPVISYTTPQHYAVGQSITSLVPTLLGNSNSWSISPALPAGLVFNTQNGQISGNPTLASAAATYTVTASNQYGSGTASFQLATGLRPSAMSYTVANPNLPTGTAVAALSPTGGTGTGATTYGISPALPAGMVFNTSTGQVSGTPTAVVANTTYTVTATNTFGSTTATLAFATGNAPAGFAYTTPNTYVAATAITALQPQYSNAPSGSLTYTVSPAMPQGLVLNATTGTISGTPAAGVYSQPTAYTVTAANAFGSASFAVNIQVQGPPTAFSYGGNISSMLNQPVATLAPQVTANPAPTYSIQPALPAGMVFNTTTGAISGTPTVVSPAQTYTVTATNSRGSATTMLTIGVTVAPPSALVYTPATVSALNGVAITTMVPTAQGGAITGWSISPALPAGLVLNTQNGQIGGALSANVQGTVNYTVTATNNGGQTTAQVTINYTIPTVMGSLAVPQSVVYGTQPWTVINPASNNPAVMSWSSSNTGVAQFRGGQMWIMGAGTATITVSQPAQGNYLASTTTATLTVTPAPLTIKPNDTYRCVGSANPTFGFTATGWVNGENASVLAAQPQLSTTATTASVAGNYAINAGGAQAANYSISYVAGQLQVNNPLNQPRRLPVVDAIAGERTPLSARMFGTTYQWSPATGLSNDRIALTTTTLTDEVTYRIAATENTGCVITDTLQVRVFWKPDVFVPSLFSPNGDGVNDQLQINPVAIGKLTYFRVFNRYGVLLFQTSDMNARWDGRFNGQLQEMGTYQWILMGVDKYGKTITRSGSTTLVR